jgi:hypothetical protein
MDEPNTDSAGDPQPNRTEIAAEIEKLKGAIGTIRSSSDRLLKNAAMLEAELREAAYLTLIGQAPNDLHYRMIKDALTDVREKHEMVGHAEYYVGMRIRELEWSLPDDAEPTGTGAAELRESGGAGGD